MGKRKHREQAGKAVPRNPFAGMLAVIGGRHQTHENKRRKLLNKLGKEYE